MSIDSNSTNQIELNKISLKNYTFKIFIETLSVKPFIKLVNLLLINFIFWDFVQKQFSFFNFYTRISIGFGLALILYSVLLLFTIKFSSKEFKNFYFSLDEKNIFIEFVEPKFTQKFDIDSIKEVGSIKLNKNFCKIKVTNKLNRTIYIPIDQISSGNLAKLQKII